jgi:hypothetical protein
MQPINPIGLQNHILGRFRLFRYCMNFGVKLAEQVQLMPKFVQRSRIEVFCNERTRSTPLDPKLMFWGISERFVTAQVSIKNGPD